MQNKPELPVICAEKLNICITLESLESNFQQLYWSSGQICLCKSSAICHVTTTLSSKMAMMVLIF